MNIQQPTPREDLYFNRYIKLTSGNDLLASLESAYQEIIHYYGELSEEQANYAYAEGKWTIKQVLAHCIDTERILAYRALCFSRNEIAELPGFDQDTYANEENSSRIPLAELLEEYTVVRRSTLLLFKRMKSENLDFSGLASNNEISPRELGWTIAGHDIHHLHVLKEKYNDNPSSRGRVSLKIDW